MQTVISPPTILIMPIFKSSLMTASQSLFFYPFPKKNTPRGLRNTHYVCYREVNHPETAHFWMIIRAYAGYQASSNPDIFQHCYTLIKRLETAVNVVGTPTVQVMRVNGSSIQFRRCRPLDRNYKRTWNTDQTRYPERESSTSTGLRCDTPIEIQRF